MQSIPRQFATFFAVLAVLYTGGFAAGQVIDTGHGEMEMEHGGGHAADPVRGLAVAEHGLRLELRTPEVEPGEAAQLRFAVAGESGAVTDFDVAHEKRMHLIVARHDLTGFQHLHPSMAADGTWTAPIRLDAPGSYRVFADFTHEGEARTLAADLRADGEADLAALPEPADVARTDGYEVRLDRHGDELAFAVTRDGEAIETEPYLGAGGHLVALREGDLAFLHVHPGDHGLTFETAFPTEGRYRLFLQFKHEGVVHTAGFTVAAPRPGSR